MTSQTRNSLMGSAVGSLGSAIKTVGGSISDHDMGTKTEKEKTGLMLMDSEGKGGIGQLHASMVFGPLTSNQKLTHSAITVQADTYCHLYELDTEDIQKFSRFVRKTKEAPIDRLLKYDDTETMVEAFKRTSVTINSGAQRKLTAELEKYAQTLPTVNKRGKDDEDLEDDDEEEDGNEDASDKKENEPEKKRSSSMASNYDDSDEARLGEDYCEAEIVFGIDELGASTRGQRRTLHWDDSSRREELKSIVNSISPKSTANATINSTNEDDNGNVTNRLPLSTADYDIKGPEDRIKTDISGGDLTTHSPPRSPKGGRDTMFATRKNSFLRPGAAPRRGSKFGSMRAGADSGSVRRTSFSLGFQKDSGGSLSDD